MLDVKITTLWYHGGLQKQVLGGKAEHSHRCPPHPPIPQLSTISRRRAPIDTCNRRCHRPPSAILPDSWLKWTEPGQGYSWKQWWNNQNEIVTINNNQRNCKQHSKTRRSLSPSVWAANRPNASGICLLDFKHYFDAFIELSLSKSWHISFFSLFRNLRFLSLSWLENAPPKLISTVYRRSIHYFSRIERQKLPRFMCSNSNLNVWNISNLRAQNLNCINKSHRSNLSGIPKSVLL